MEKLSFKANVGIKDIIGRGLILDDNIAVIELIKNSKDADSPKVEIIFSDSKLKLIDFGRGMDIDDIKNKWLNIAYSEKKEVKKQSGEAYAGNKGVGRFSCDRLGKKLVLYTKSNQGDYIKLPIDWSRFEINDMNKEISHILLGYEKLSKEEFLDQIGMRNFQKGTVLEITNLRTEWDKKKLDKLQAELEKFVSAPDNKFQVSLDKNIGETKPIKNNVFDELEFRTYYIKSSIDHEGQKINTALYYHGQPIYEYVAVNPYKNLKDISLTVHYLNFTAKSYFKKRTGFRSNDYGSVFLFLNDFRVLPYGNPKNDWLGIDQRKSQGVARYLGTRDVIGQITITDYEDLFTPVTSREGIVNGTEFLELTAHDKKQKIVLSNGKKEYGYVPYIIRQLEHFVVEGVKWQGLVDLENPYNNKVINDGDLKKDPTRYTLHSVNAQQLENTIQGILNSNNFEIETFKINKPLIKRLSKEAKDAYNEYILSFIKNTTGKKFDDLAPNHKGDFRKIAEDNMRSLKAQREAEIKAEQEKQRADEAEQKVVEEKLRADEAERQSEESKVKAEAAKKVAKIATKKLKDVKVENLFLKADASKDLDHILNLHHQIILYASTADSEIQNLKDTLSSKEFVSVEEIQEFLLSIEDNIARISKISDFATNQQYMTAVEEIKGNLIKFISDYIDDLNDNNLLSRKMVIKNNLDKTVVFETVFSPMDIMIMVDNFISNTRKTKTREIIFSSPISKNGLFLVGDEGPGLDAEIEYRYNIFEKGFTTTGGSGRGLYYVQETLKKMNLGIKIIDSKKTMTGLTLEIFKNVD